MQEQSQKIYDIEKMYLLCEDIIQNRKFESLIELNEQCVFLCDKVISQLHNMNNNAYDFSIEEDAIFLLLYYIYYIVLTKKERKIFYSLSKLIFYKNTLIYDIYKDLDVENFDKLEEYNCAYYAMNILYTYMGLEEEKENNFSNINNFIYFVIDNNYSTIRNDFYLLYMLGIGVLDYKKVLSNFSYDALIQRFKDVADIIIERGKNKTFLPENEDCDNKITKEIDKINF